MLIYCYADILGYRDLLRNYSVHQVRCLLDDCFAEMYKAIGRIEQIIFKGEEIKTYIAFDTVVIYWEGFEYNREGFRAFLQAINIIYLILYDKGVLIRGAIGASVAYCIENDRGENNVAHFIIDNIDIAAVIEKEQNWSSIIVFGRRLIELTYCVIIGQADDYFERLEYYNNRERNLSPMLDGRERYTVPLKKDRNRFNIADYALKGEGRIQQEDLLDGINAFIMINPFNRFCYSFFGEEFFARIKSKLEKVINDGMGKREHNHSRELRYRTAKHLYRTLTDYERSLSRFDYWKRDK